jgi:hypothetical protein
MLCEYRLCVVLSVVGASLVWSVSTVTGFSANLPKRQTSRTLPSILLMAPLTDEEIFARAQQRKAAEEEEQEPPPMLFDDDMLKDMQAALLLLERRATEGPGALSHLEVDQLDGQLQKIIREMKQNENLKPPRPLKRQEPVPVTGMVPPPPTTGGSTPVSASSSTSIGSVQAGPKVIDMDTPSDEGAEYNGRGGMGQAADTTNTYIIPGMDEMSPDEYQRELQRSVIERQAQRKRSGVTGNRSSWDYLNQLTGESGVLKKTE